MSAAVYQYYLDTVEKPESMEEKDFARTLRARAFDVGRYCLPLATHTSVGQITSARTLERQISRLLASPFGEVRRVAEAMREAGRAPARNPRDERLLELLEELGDDAAALGALREALQPVAAAPTLVKYTAPDIYRIETLKIMREVYEGLLGKVPVGVTEAVTLVEVDDPAVEALSKLLYTVGRHPFSQIVLHVQTLSRPEIRELLEMAFQKRGSTTSGCLSFVWAISILTWSWISEPFGTCTGTAGAKSTGSPFPPIWDLTNPKRLPLPARATVYREAMKQAFAVSEKIEAAQPPLGAYILPLGTRCRALFSMDWAELAYIAELRTLAERALFLPAHRLRDVSKGDSLLS